MNRRYRLTRSIDYNRVRRTGKSYAHPLVVMVVKCNSLATIRVGFSTSRSIRGAVSRNRTKRLLREVARGYLADMRPGWDIIFIARPPILKAEWAEIKQAASSLLMQSGILVKSNDKQPSTD